MFWMIFSVSCLLCIMVLWNKVTAVEKHDSVEISFAVAAVTMKSSAVPNCPWPAVLLMCHSSHRLSLLHYSYSLYGNWMEFWKLFFLYVCVCYWQLEWRVTDRSASLLKIYWTRKAGLRSHQMGSEDKRVNAVSICIFLAHFKLIEYNNTPRINIQVLYTLPHARSHYTH